MATEIPSDVEKLLDPTMNKKLFETVTVGKATYYFIDQYDDDGGEPVIVRSLPGASPMLVDDILAEDDATGGGATGSFSPQLQERLKAIRGEFDDAVDDTAGGAAPLSQAEVNKRLRAKAMKCADRNDPEHLSSRDAPGTDHGNLACAWAVNQVAKKALGREIGGGLATANMVVVLRDKHKRATDLVSGCVIISPTVTRLNGTRNIGHVGIVGEVNTADKDQTKIYSNSSGAAEFQQNFTYARWRGKYKDDKGLSVEFFELDPQRFPNAGT
ncbi:hypothetical protein [Rhizobium mongolense]|uniref:CHAP domain-containing protein n=2 Tax=Rhizobium mongolense TaxID=57676 RepID=A0ABR6IZ95_9HYPH|nr:hypothetical protein [Rhizobium mongolense]MBB4233247.1 hypothetical protein [Rhizobium mongolense]TVZ74777.1 hypothetical protein BCL32_0089 [Rhizobium mongolense USDA 1844]